MRDLLGNYSRALNSVKGSDEKSQMGLVYAHGFLLGAELYQAAAAVEVAFHKSFPDEPFPTFSQ